MISIYTHHIYHPYLVIMRAQHIRTHLMMIYKGTNHNYIHPPSDDDARNAYKYIMQYYILYLEPKIVGI